MDDLKVDITRSLDDAVDAWLDSCFAIRHAVN